MRRHLLALAAFFVPVALIACGSSGGGTGGSGGGTGGGTTTTTSSTSSSGTTTTSSSSSSTTSSSSSSGTPQNHCTNAADLAIIQDSSKDVQGNTATCGQQNLGADPATKNCIIMKTGLSDACAQCFADTVSCAVQHCFSQCISDPGSQACTDCRAQNCDPAFYLCSGIDPSAGADAGADGG